MRYLLLISLLYLTFRVSQAQSDTSGLRPNVLLILSDDHSYPYLSCYGHPDAKTPNIDDLAQRGVRFDQAYTAAPQCVPSRAAILTGRNVIDIRMSRFSAPLSRDIPALPDLLGKAGYYTGICGRHYHLDGSARRAAATDSAVAKYDMVTFPDRTDYVTQGKDEVVLKQFQTFLDQVPSAQPFFMWMNYSDPHRPFSAQEYAPDPTQLTIPDAMPDTEEVRDDLAQHIGEVNRLDAYVGEVLSTLDRRGLTNNTVIFFMGDNGAALLRGKGTLYDLGIHVPLVVAGPGVVRGEVSQAQILGTDLAPTILEMTSAEIPEKMTGQSFTAALKGMAYPGHDYIFATRVSHGSGIPINTVYFDLIRTVFDRDFKLIYNILWPLPYEPVDFNNSRMWRDLEQRYQDHELPERFENQLFSHPRPMFELYDRRSDPAELHNLADQPAYQEIAHQLKEQLQEWMIRYQDYANLPIPHKEMFPPPGQLKTR